MICCRNNTLWKITLAGIVAINLWCLPGAGRAQDKAKSTSTTPGLLAYVLLGEKQHALQGETVPMLRLVLEHAQGFSDATCSTMTVSNSTGTKLTLVTRPNLNPKDLPISLCETAFPFAKKFLPQGETWTATTADGRQYPLQLPTVSQAPELALIIGDTGCRDNKAQSCDAKEWPLPATMTQHMADILKKQNKPALFVHVGDYKYRGKNDSKPAKDSETGLKWRNWKADFFDPMSGVGGGPNLFAMAAWVVARGNHELCNSMGNNGESWFFLLDPTSTVAGDSAQQLTANSCRGVADGLTRPYRLDFSNGLSIVVMDSAGLNETKAVCETDKKELSTFFKELANSFKGSQQNAWLVTHKPMWVVNGGCDKARLGNATPLAAIEELEHHALPKNIKLALAGHKHYYASLDINPDEEQRRMLELVVGNGGVALNPDAYNGCIKLDEKGRKDLHIEVQGMSRFGFVVAKLDVSKDGKKVDGWKLESKALDKVTGPAWGELKEAAVCEYPVKKGKPACEVKEKNLFSHHCSNCNKVKGAEKQVTSCQSEDDGIN